MNPYQRLVRRIGTTRAFAWFGRHVLTPMDSKLVGRRRALTTLGTSFPLCYLTTTGRTSGKPRTVPLLYVEEGDAIVVAATNFGGDRHPGWAYNLEADPTARISVGGAEHVVSARAASDVEVAKVWAKLCNVWPAYDAYRHRAGREIKVFLLEKHG